MSAPVLQQEEMARRHQDVFVERERELEQMANKMPKPLAGEFPYLMGIKDGVIYPYTAQMAARDDLVVGCYNLEGSTDPEDWERGYDPSAVASAAEERAKRIHETKGVSAAERKSWEAAERKRIRAEMEAQIRAEILAESGASGEAPAPAPAAPAKKTTARKKATKAADKPSETTTNATVETADDVVQAAAKPEAKVTVSEQSLAADVSDILNAE